LIFLQYYFFFGSLIFKSSQLILAKKVKIFLCSSFSLFLCQTCYPVLQIFLPQMFFLLCLFLSIPIHCLGLHPHCFSFLGVWTLGFALAKQILYHLSHAPVHFALVILKMGVSWTVILPISAFQVAGITGMSHQYLAVTSLMYLTRCMTQWFSSYRFWNFLCRRYSVGPLPPLQWWQPHFNC
jgi:hypothetical protein